LLELIGQVTVTVGVHVRTQFPDDRFIGYAFVPVAAAPRLFPE